MEEKNNRKWYIVQVVTGYEQRVKDDLENRDFDKGEIEEILFAQIKNITKTGKVRMKSLFPGYLYVKVEMTDDSWFIIRNTNYVTGIVGSSGQRTKPTPIRDEEISKIKSRMIDEELRNKKVEENLDEKQLITSVDYAVKDKVKIKEGEFNNYEGKVSAISIETQKASVEIEFFGRITTIEVDLTAIEKV